MAKILSFERRSQISSRATTPTGIPAIVVIFPGVRYEKTAQREVESDKRSNEAGAGPPGTIQ